MKKTLALFATVLAAVLNAATPSTSLVYVDTTARTLTGNIVAGNNTTISASGNGTITATAAPLTGLTGLGTGVSTFLATPSSANLASAVTNETGSGALVFATSPTLVTPVIGAATGTSLLLTGAASANSVSAPTVAGSTYVLTPLLLSNTNQALTLQTNGGTLAATFSTAGDTTLAGNLTVSGTATSAFSGGIKARSGGADEVGVGPYGTGNGGIYFGNGTVSLFNDANTQLKSLVGLSLAGNLTVSGSIVNQNGVIQSTLAAGALISSLSTNNNAVHGFQISGTGTGTRDWRLEQCRGGANSFSISNLTGGVTTPLIVNGATDNILIGYSSTTSDGGQKLQVNGNATFAGAISVAASAADAKIDLKRTAVTNSSYIRWLTGSSQNWVIGTGATGNDTNLTFYSYDGGGSALILASSTGNATFAGTVTATGGIVGTTTNDSAAAGIVGQYVSSTVASASAVSLSNGTAANVTSISLTAGDWDVSAKVGFKPNASTTISYMLAAVSDTSAASTEANRIVLPLNGATTAYNVEATVPTVRISIASTTTIYLVASSEFAVSTQSAFGTIIARRVR